ncbi:10614_t:CDS:1, partial [Gigaspora rosea]
RQLETLTIPDSAFEQATGLYIGMKFDYWDYAYLVLLAYGQKT